MGARFYVTRFGSTQQTHWHADTFFIKPQSKTKGYCLKTNSYCSSHMYTVHTYEQFS